MTYSTMVSLSRRALQLTTLLVATASVSFGGESVPSDREAQLIGHVTVTAARERELIGHVTVTAARERELVGHMVVTAVREHELMGHLVVTADRLAPETVAIADLGAMTVTARRETPLASNDAPHAGSASL
jgi:hypothetical protein